MDRKFRMRFLNSLSHNRNLKPLLSYVEVSIENLLF